MAAANVPQSSLTQYHWMGDQRRKGLGSRGTFTMDFTAGAYPFIGLNYTCLVPAANPRDVNAPGAATIDRWIDPLEVNTDNTLLMLDGFAVITRIRRQRHHDARGEDVCETGANGPSGRHLGCPARGSAATGRGHRKKGIRQCDCGHSR